MPRLAVFLGLGSNVDPEQNLRDAVSSLRQAWPAIRFSGVYRSKALEVEDQPDFLNAVARLETEGTPERILSTLQTIERKLGKAPPFRFGPRTIDLDVLLYGNDVLPSKQETNQRITIPHPRMHKRRFVLEPLLELIDPQAEHPVLHRAWKDLLHETLSQSCEKTGILLP